MTEFSRGDRVLIDRSVYAIFVRYSGGSAVVKIGEDTRVVDPVILSTQEG